MQPQSHHPSISPRVSVVIPCFNYGRFLGQTLHSVLEQTEQNWECIVVDDGSTDDTAAVAARFTSDPRIRYHRQPNRGQAAAKNMGLRWARGQYVQLLDADDVIEQRKLELQADFLDDHPDVDIVYGTTRFFHTERPDERRYSLFETDRPWMPEISGSGKPMVMTLIRQNIMQPHAALTRLQVFRELNGFDESLRRADDWDFWLRCALRGKRFQFTPIDGTMSLVRIHGSSLTQSNRKLIESSLQRHRKLASATTDPDILRANEEAIGWLEQVQRVSALIDASIAPGEKFILADEDKLREDLIGYRTVPFTEDAGQYGGPPADGPAAVAELERLRNAGARAIVFAWPAMWYLEHYSELRAHLERRYPLTTAAADAVIYDLR